ncbi:DUF4091 domain-containing protein [Paenibacillus cymbidii]|uniref:DUF4091 domain-containing protein n=1 Tax=Paenibacillus cymbidii TaxID=1639034 RepID=UPI001080D6EC|nr:DUF4091 domain-containing protein [Paenibacillus cymbidii]
MIKQEQIKAQVLAKKANLKYRYGLPEQAEVLFWVQDTLQRVYPHSAPEGGTSLELYTARNARLSFQACLNNNGLFRVNVNCEVSGEDEWTATVRRVGWVQQDYLTLHTLPSELDGVQNVPGLVPDPLFPETTAEVGPLANQSFWVSVHVPADAKPGVHTLKVKFTSPVMDELAELSVRVNVHSAVIQPRKNFPVTHWWYPECIFDWYGQEPLGEAFMQTAKPYLQNLFDHGTDVLYVPLLNYRKEFMKRPPQLLKVWEVSEGVYQFDWTYVRQIVRMAKEIGFGYFEWSHFWAYSHAKEHSASASEPTRIYTERNGQLDTLFPEHTDATGEVFRRYMEQFIGEFKQFMIEEGILHDSLFHICDEPTDRPEDVANYKKAREFLLQIDPSVKVMDAISGNEYLNQRLTDYPVPLVDRAVDFMKRGEPHWAYYCCGPTGPYMNRFFDTPLAKIRPQGMVFYKLGTLGFLHWGYNYWYTQKRSSAEQEYGQDAQTMADLFSDASAGRVFPYGDPFVVYPGENGPIDSIRWEVFAEAMQDYALLQTLGIDPKDERLEAIVDYANYPKEAEWFRRFIRELLQ